LQQAAAVDEVNMMRRHGCPPKRRYSLTSFD
jgi:hypothetical protein